MVLINLGKNTYIHPQKKHDSEAGIGELRRHYGVDHYRMKEAPPPYLLKWLYMRKFRY